MIFPQAGTFIPAHIKVRRTKQDGAGKMTESEWRAKLESANDERRTSLRSARFRRTFGEPPPRQGKIRIERERLFESSNGALMLTK
jgi:hypothetical protein